MMSRRKFILLSITLLLTFGLCAGGCRETHDAVSFGGGPAGGTFYVAAKGMAELIEEEIPGTVIEVTHSGGSVYNLGRVDAGQAGMAIVYAGDALEGREGRLSVFPRPLSRVMGVARLYGGSAHLAVLKRSTITSPYQLKGLRVGVGYPGSATAISAEKFFRSLGLWESIFPDYHSYDLAAREFKRGRIAALWQMVGPPSASLADINRSMPIRLLDLGQVVQESSFYQQNPYAPCRIPGGTYSGIDDPVETFCDQAIWVASSELDERFIYRAITLLFSEEGMNRLKKVHPALGELSLEEGGRLGDLPLHPGAERFWREREK